MLERLLTLAIFRDEDEPALLLDFLGREPGIFVEVGAFDPVEFSQTYQLEMLGWRGILIEPVAEHAQRLREHRSAAVYQVAAGAPEDEGRQAPLIVAGGLSTLRSSIKSLAGWHGEQRQVEIRTLDSVLADARIDVVDFVSIDVEGMEVPVLRGFSLGKFRPRLVLIEDDTRDLSKHRHMLAANYKLVRRTAINSWYVPRDAPFPVSLLGRWQLFRKLYLGLLPRRLKYAFPIRKRRSQSVS